MALIFPDKPGLTPEEFEAAAKEMFSYGHKTPITYVPRSVIGTRKVAQPKPGEFRYDLMSDSKTLEVSCVCEVFGPITGLNHNLLRYHDGRPHQLFRKSVSISGNGACSAADERAFRMRAMHELFNDVKQYRAHAEYALGPPHQVTMNGKKLSRSDGLKAYNQMEF